MAAIQNQTQNQLIKVLENFASDHLQLQSFQFGYSFEFAVSGDTIFPQLFVEPLPHSHSNKAIFNNYRLIFADSVSKGDRNRDEVLSDMLEIAKDAIAQLQHPDYKFILQENIPLQDFYEKFDEEVSGYIATVSIKTAFDNDRCQIPTDGIQIPTSADQSIVTITDAENPLSPIKVTPGGKYTCTECTPFDTSCRVLNDLLTQTERNTLQRIASIKTGQTHSYAERDDGDREDGRGVDFFTLDCNNPFGNPNRFTDINGLQVYGDKYMIDHQGEGLGWYLLSRGTGNWATVMEAVKTDTILGYDDWFIPNRKQFESLIYEGETVSNYRLGYDPVNNFGLGNANIWTGTTYDPTPTNAARYITAGGNIVYALKTLISNHRIICRKHY